MIVLNPNEKIDSWDVVVVTTDGRELNFLSDLGLGEVPDTMSYLIDDMIKAKYPVTWTDYESEVEK